MELVINFKFITKFYHKFIIKLVMEWYYINTEIHSDGCNLLNKLITYFSFQKNLVRYKLKSVNIFNLFFINNNLFYNYISSLVSSVKFTHILNN